jgi:hemoglobin-like flavoprotein
MTPEQIGLVERTLPTARELDAVVADFYERLFATDPALREMFSTDPAVQRAKFVAELHSILLAIRGHQEFLKRAGALGARHVGYGVRASHYRTVGSALLAAMAAALGEAWTEPVEQAWRLAYNLTAEVMIAGAVAGGELADQAGRTE